VALQANGKVVVWGDNSLGQATAPAGLSNVVEIAAGGGHTMALAANGTVVAWGENTDADGTFVGQSIVPLGLSNVVAMGAGDYHSLAVKSNGTVVTWGDDSQSQCDAPPGLASLVAMRGGSEHSLGLKLDGSPAAWGANWDGQCNLDSNLTNVVAVAAGGNHTLLLLEGSAPAFRLLNPTRNGAGFSGVLQTLSRKNYALEFKPSLSSTSWTSLPTVTGNGSLRQLSDTPGNTPQRFYRVRQW
jgi:alpha-tubulin suppressor-like RCC1 family protein